MNMDSQIEYAEPVTPAICFESLNKNEDSGYHTFTPSSLESEISSDFADAPIHKNTISCCHLQSIKHSWSKSQKIICSETPPQIKRGVKRLYQDIETVSPAYNSVPTPTSAIARKIKTLDVNENKENATYFMSPIGSNHDSVPREFKGLLEYEFTLSYPTTPVKNNCKVNPCRRTPKKLNFIHSLSCESHALQQVKKHTPRELKTLYFRPEQKIDIVHLLNQEVCLPAISKIFDYLSNEDINNFRLVSKTWINVWDGQTTKRKQDYLKHLCLAKENRENRDRGNSLKIKVSKQTRLLNEIQNVLSEDNVNNIISRSPPSTPRTNRFKKFVKAALIDSRNQLSCCRCQQPAKVTEEASGEVWVECTSILCSYQFCKYCRCGRHPGTTCLQYDLEGPSPSKRKKSQYSIGTKKSRKSLRRLIDMSC